MTRTGIVAFLLTSCLHVSPAVSQSPGACINDKLPGYYECTGHCQPGKLARVKREGSTWLFVNEVGNEAKGERHTSHFMVGPAHGWDQIKATPNSSCDEIEFVHPNYKSVWKKK